MTKRLAIGTVVLLLVVGAALAILARSVLTGDHVRAAVAAQLSDAIGQPVTVGGLAASAYPRVRIDLTDVSIGQPTRIHLPSLQVGADLRALFSRRIERATVRIDGARLDLPLPDLRTGATRSSRGLAGAEPGGAPPVEIVSIDEIVLTNVEVVSGGRTLHGDVELVPQGGDVVLRRVSLIAGDTALEMTGVLTSLSPVEGRLDTNAREADLDRMLLFLSDFASTAASMPGQEPARGIEGRLTVDLSIDRATTGGLRLSDLYTTALVTPDSVTLDPLTLGVFDGRYEGAMTYTIEDVPRYTWRATLAGVDAATLMAFADTPNSISGTLSGSLALEGEGLAMEQALRTARGTARVDITDGAVAGLGLVRALVTATSGRGGVVASARAGMESREDAAAEQFSRLGATLAVADGRMATSDFTLASTDVEWTSAGTVSIATMTTEMEGRGRLSEELSREAGTDLYRYAQEDGRVILPATVTGPLGNLSVRIDIGDAASRALRNRAAEEARKVIERNLPERLRLPIPRRPPG